MEKIIKIAIFAPHLVRTHPAGWAMLNILNELSHDGSFLFTVYGKEIDIALRGKVEFKKIPIPILKPRILTYIVQYLIYAILFKKIQKKFDIIHAIEITTPYAHIVTMHYCGAKVKDLISGNHIRYKGIERLIKIITMAAGTIMEKRTLTKNPFLKAIISVSHGLKDCLEHYYSLSNRIEHYVIPNPAVLKFDLDEANYYRNKIREELKIDNHDIVGVICALGNWKHKGLDLIIKTFEEEPEIPITIIVVGGNVKKYIRICQEKNILEKFRFIGHTSNPEIYIASSDFFILPSAFEAFPLVAIEAALCEKPIIGTKIPGLEDLIEPGVTGYFIDRTTESIKQIFNIIMQSREQLAIMGKNAKIKISQFELKKITQEYKNLYKKFSMEHS